MILFLCISITNAGATSFSFTETFLADDDQYFEVWQGWEATFAFNLTAEGDYAQLKNKWGRVKDTVLPNPDAVDFIPDEYTINSATLDFTFSSQDACTETVTINAGLMDGDRLITKKKYDLGFFWDRTRYSANLSLDLIDLGFKNYLNDGKFDSIVLAFGNKDLGCNDFRIDDATLEVIAHAPEPGTFLMMGVGLIGLGTLLRKKTTQK
jgi:hypothetical protein